ncbi:MAG: hypothetical protein ACK4N5_02295 [Myxococcales bacterium]
MSNFGSPIARATPRPLGEILAEALRLYTGNLVAMLLTAGIALAPIYLVKNTFSALFAPSDDATAHLKAEAERIEALNRRMEERLREGTATPEELEELQREILEASGGALFEGGALLARTAGLLLTLLLTVPLLLLASFLAQAALTVLVADRAEGGTLGWAGAWAKLPQRLPALLATAMVAIVGVVLGLVLCVLPGVAFAFFCAFAMPVALLENRAGPEAIRRSFALVKADWLRVLVVLVIFAVLSAVANSVGNALVPASMVFLRLMIGDLISVLLLPVPIIGLVLLYRDGLVRRGEMIPSV